jgi:hypothetical protein
MADGHTASLTVVVATTERWPHLRPCLDALLPEVKRVGADLIVVDGHGEGLPSNDAPSYEREVSWVRKPGASVFELRAAGVTQAKSEIVVTTEDHCIVRDGWCESILEAHRQHPEASVIGGAVYNGSRHGMGDWANFLMTFAAFTPPMQATSRWPTAANISYKRGLLSENPEAGWLDFEFPPAQRTEGKVVLDERIALAHIQSDSLIGHVVRHFHNGRSTAGHGFGRGGNQNRSLARRLKLPVKLTLEALMFTRGKYERPYAIRSLPAIIVLAIAHSLGELVGSLAGQGRSPKYLA